MQRVVILLYAVGIHTGCSMGVTPTVLPDEAPVRIEQAEAVPKAEVVPEDIPSASRVAEFTRTGVDVVSGEAARGALDDDATYFFAGVSGNTCAFDMSDGSMDADVDVASSEPETVTDATDDTVVICTDDGVITIDEDGNEPQAGDTGAPDAPTGGEEARDTGATGSRVSTLLRGTSCVG